MSEPSAESVHCTCWDRVNRFGLRVQVRDLKCPVHALTEEEQNDGYGAP